jgi:hypothetical protein
MSRFKDILRKVDAQLELPQPEKSRILLEIAGDLSDAYDAGIEEGLSEEEATRRAADMFDLSGEALSELVRIHETGFQKFLAGLSGQARTRWERIVLLVLIHFVFIFSGKEIVTTKLFTLSGPFVWPVAGFSLIGFTIILVEIYRLYIKRRYDVRRIRSGPLPLLAVSGAIVLTGFTGSVVGLFRAAGRIASGSGEALLQVIDWALGSSALMMVSLLSAMTVAIAWFILDNKVRRIEEAEMAWLEEE